MAHRGHVGQRLAHGRRDHGGSPWRAGALRRPARVPRRRHGDHRGRRPQGRIDPRRMLAADLAVAAPSVQTWSPIRSSPLTAARTGRGRCAAGVATTIGGRVGWPPPAPTSWCGTGRAGPRGAGRDGRPGHARPRRAGAPGGAAIGPGEPPPHLRRSLPGSSDGLSRRLDPVEAGSDRSAYRVLGSPTSGERGCPGAITETSGKLRVLVEGAIPRLRPWRGRPSPASSPRPCEPARHRSPRRWAGDHCGAATGTPPRRRRDGALAAGLVVDERWTDIELLRRTAFRAT